MCVCETNKLQARNDIELYLLTHFIYDALTRFILKPTFAAAGAVRANGLQVFHAAPGAWPPHGYQARSGLEEDKCRCSPNYARLVACWWHSIELNGYNQRRQIHPPKKLTSHTHFLQLHFERTHPPCD
jgi:hypothetical protein